MHDRCKNPGAAAPSAFQPFAIPTRTGKAGTETGPDAVPVPVRRPRCPDCDSKWIGFAIPRAAVVVLADGSLTEITLAHSGSCRFLDFHDVALTSASCLDCGTHFDATPTRTPMQQLGDAVAR